MALLHIRPASRTLRISAMLSRERPAFYNYFYFRIFGIRHDVMRSSSFIVKYHVVISIYLRPI